MNLLFLFKRDVPHVTVFGDDLDLTGRKWLSIASRGAVPRHQQAQMINANDNVVSLEAFRARKAAKLAA